MQSNNAASATADAATRLAAHALALQEAQWDESGHSRRTSQTHVMLNESHMGEETDNPRGSVHVIVGLKQHGMVQLAIAYKARATGSVGWVSN
jgi:hypothetical protein